MTTVKKPRKSKEEHGELEVPKSQKRTAGTRAVSCADRKPGDPILSVLGNITGMPDERSPMSNMRMHYRGRKSGPPELKFDIDLEKGVGEDEKYVLSNEPSEEERERRMQRRLCQLEGELKDLWEQLEFVKGLRKEWNAQKAGLCNRKLKDSPPFCCRSPIAKD